MAMRSPRLDSKAVFFSITPGLSCSTNEVIKVQFLLFLIANGSENLMAPKLATPVLTIAILMSTSASVLGQNDKGVPSLETIFAAWDALEVVRPTRVRSFGSEDDDNRWREILLAEDCFLDNSRRLNSRRIIGKNRQYWFELSSQPNDLTRWSLAGIGKVPLPEKLQEQWDLFGLPEVEETIRFAGYKLKDFLNHPAVETLEIRRNSKQSDLIEVAFSVSSDRANSGFRPIRVKSGVLRLSEANQFLLAGYSMELPQGNFDVEFSDVVVQGRLSSIPEKITIRQQGKVVQVRNFEIHFEPVNQNEFRVTSFGLSEPPGIFLEPRYLNTWTIAATTILVLAILFTCNRYLNR